jgi:hypothetical protein
MISRLRSPARTVSRSSAVTPISPLTATPSAKKAAASSAIGASDRRSLGSAIDLPRPQHTRRLAARRATVF